MGDHLEELRNVAQHMRIALNQMKNASIRIEPESTVEHSLTDLSALPPLRVTLRRWLRLKPEQHILRKRYQRQPHMLEAFHRTRACFKVSQAAAETQTPSDFTDSCCARRHRGTDNYGWSESNSSTLIASTGVGQTSSSAAHPKSPIHYNAGEAAAATLSGGACGSDDNLLATDDDDVQQIVQLIREALDRRCPAG